jgi:hypothetical protein
LTGIATELGRIEQKVAQIGSRGSGLNLGELIEALQDIFQNPPDYTYPSGSYVLEPICDYDENGDLMPEREVTWPGGSGELAELGEKLDAIAELIQVHKELRQPICGGSHGAAARLGTPVTVTFEQEEL